MKFLCLKIHSKRKTEFFIKLPPREPGVGSDKPDEFIELPELGKRDNSKWSFLFLAKHKIVDLSTDLSVNRGN